MDIVHKQKELGSFVGRLLREQFGKGPETVFASVGDPFVVIYFTKFLSPLEKSLLDLEQGLYVQKTRDLLMETLVEEIKAYIKLHVGLDIKEFYYDWNLKEQSGMFTAISEKKAGAFMYPNKKQVEEVMADLTFTVQKVPEQVFSYLINPRTLLIIRKGLLVPIEKELHRLDFGETLKLAKRNLERRIFQSYKQQFEKTLQADVTDFFVDWNFDQDKSSSLLILKPYNRQQ